MYREMKSYQVCSTRTTFLRSGLGLLSPARVCFLLRSSLTLFDSSIVFLSLLAVYTGFGRCLVLIERSVKHVDSRQMIDGTHRTTFPTSLSIFHRSTRLLRYSTAALSLAVTIPSRSEAFPFHIRTFPSSEPDRTKRASVVKRVEVTLFQTVFSQEYRL